MDNVENCDSYKVGNTIYLFIYIQDISCNDILNLQSSIVNPQLYR
jgi:hypothetical protein